MTAQTVIAENAFEASASRAIALVSPRDGVVALGPILPDDLGLVFLWLNDAGAALTDMPYRPVDCVAYKEWLDRLPAQTNSIFFSIRTVVQSRPVGFVLFKNFQSVFRSAELGLRIGAEQERGKGYGTRAMRLALAYAWETLNLHRVSLTVFADNPRAIAVYCKAGFRQEGVMRHAAFTGGRWRDVVVMAALNPRD
jgi:RimJ/RimL family protein N-acetyltransferase